MTESIAFTGKGGVGKTTCLVLFLKFLIEKKKDSRILVIDADPDSNIADLVGYNVDFNDTIAGKMHSLMYKIQNENISPYETNKQAIEAEIFNCILHENKFDLVEMGRTEGSGCYCSINNVLKNTLDIIAENYNYVLFDSPAGLEHFARKTGKDVSDLLIIVDPSKMAIHTLKRILTISEELSLEFRNYWVLGNRISKNQQKLLIKQINALPDNKINLLGFIPEDRELMQYNLFNENLLNVPANNAAYREMKKLSNKIIQTN
ncbi:MAG: hypothetical protein EU532_03815 [Promethearchaeota archaeon]|nr:MAG: hypothetical protein EU532_03815 [Candidatus Lokiarchaeota archaeon]